MYTFNTLATYFYFLTWPDLRKCECEALKELELKASYKVPPPPQVQVANVFWLVQSISQKHDK